jgi:transposase
MMFTELPSIDPKCKKTIEKTITFLEKQIKEMEEELASLAQGEYKKQMDLLTSIKGIGVTLAAPLIVATGRFSYFDNAKQLTRYLGLSPTYQQSGTSVNVKGHINRNGDSSLRSQLYVAAFSSLRCNTECKACFDRLRSNGKPGKVVVIAVANKLVRQAFAVVTQGKPYVDGFKSEKP